MNTYETAFEINSELFGGDEYVWGEDVRRVQKILERRLEAGQHETLVMLLLRETAMRCRIAFPKNEQDETWFNEGTDKDRCGDFMQRLFNTMEVYYDD